MPIVIFDFLETLISEFDSGHPSTTEVAQTLQLPVKEFQQEYQNLRLERLTGQFSGYAAVLRYIIRKLEKFDGEVFLGKRERYPSSMSISFQSPFGSRWYTRKCLRRNESHGESAYASGRVYNS